MGNLQNVKRHPKSRLDISTEVGQNNDGNKILTSYEQEMQNNLYPYLEDHEFDGITEWNKRLQKRWYDRLVRQMYDRLARSHKKRFSSGLYDRLVRQGFDRLSRMAYDRLGRAKYDRLAKAKYDRLTRATFDSSQKEAFGCLDDLPTLQVLVHSKNEGPWYPRLIRSREEANDDQDNFEISTMENERNLSRLKKRGAFARSVKTFHRMMRSGDIHRMMRPADLDQIMNSSDLHRMMRSGDLHRMMRSDEFHRMMRSSDLHRMMRSDKFHRMMPSSDLHRMMRSMHRTRGHCLKPRNYRMDAEINTNDDTLSKNSNEAGCDNENDDDVVDLGIDNLLGKNRYGRSAFDRLMRSNIKNHDENGKLGHQIGIIPIDDESKIDEDATDMSRILRSYLKKNRAWEMVNFLSRN